MHRIWDKWASNCVGSSDESLKAALLLNYDPTGPSRLSSTIAEQEGIIADPIEMSQFLRFYKSKHFQSETFFIGLNEYMVTTIHENWFSARCISKAADGGAIVMQSSAFLLVGLYDGSISSASCAIVAIDHFHGKLLRRNL